MYQPTNFEGTRLLAVKLKHDDNPNSYVELRRLADEQAKRQQKVEAVGKPVVKPTKKGFIAATRIKGVTPAPTQPPRVGGPRPRAQGM